MFQSIVEFVMTHKIIFTILGFMFVWYVNNILAIVVSFVGIVRKLGRMSPEERKKWDAEYDQFCKDQNQKKRSK